MMGAGKSQRGHSCKCSWELKMAGFLVSLQGRQTFNRLSNSVLLYGEYNTLGSFVLCNIGRMKNNEYI